MATKEQEHQLLPIEDSQSPDSEELVAPEEILPRKPRILVVEEDESSRIFIHANLLKTEHQPELESTLNTELALAKIRHTPVGYYHVIIVGGMSPKSEQFLRDVLRYKKASADDRLRIKALVYGEEDGQKALGMGAEAYYKVGGHWEELAAFSSKESSVEEKD